jgi:cytochrome c biogenesis protein CcmG/thiol:disulfide interchange protein DsbE
MIAPGLPRRRLLLLAPLGVVAAGGVAFWSMLDRMQQGRFDPHDIGNPMLGKPIPDFSLPAVASGQGFSSADLRAAARVQPVVLNFFASWCVPCAAEAETLAAMHDQGVPLWGIAYKDKPEKTAAFLNQYGNPYARLAADTTGSTFIDFGLYGVPENFVIDAQGRIAWHLAGPLSESVIEQQLAPALQKARA